MKSSPSIRIIARLFILATLISASGCSFASKEKKISDSDLFILGTRDLEKQKYEKAKAAFKQIVDQYPDSQHRVDALLNLAHSLYQEEEYEEARFHYQKFVELYPMRPEAAKAQYFLAMTSFLRWSSPDREAASMREASEAFEKLIKQYPGSPYVKLAQEKIDLARQRLLTQELLIAKFYYQTKAYQAAIGRLKGILAQNPSAGKLVEETLFYLGEAYLQEDSRAQAKRVFGQLLLRFPGSSYAPLASRRLSQLP